MKTAEMAVEKEDAQLFIAQTLQDFRHMCRWVGPGLERGRGKNAHF